MMFAAVKNATSLQTGLVLFLLSAAMILRGFQVYGGSKDNPAPDPDKDRLLWALKAGGSFIMIVAAYFLYSAFY